MGIFGRMVTKNLETPASATRILPIIGLVIVGLVFVVFNTFLPLLAINTETSTSRHEHQWVDFNCFQPLSRPVLGDYKNWKVSSSTSIKAPRIINVGFPKCGSTTLNNFLSTAQPYNLSNKKALISHHDDCIVGGNTSKVASFINGGNSSNFRMTTCGNCIQDSINRGLPPLTTCGDYIAYTQLDFNVGMACIYPQISYLKEIYDEEPSAIFLLPFRNVTDWIRSVSNWNTLRKRMINNCEFPEYNLTKGWGTDKDFTDLYCKHVKHIRQFVSKRPTLTLVEYSISRDDAGDYLASTLPHMKLNGVEYGHANANAKMIPKRNIQPKQYGGD